VSKHDIASRLRSASVDEQREVEDGGLSVHGRSFPMKGYRLAVTPVGSVTGIETTGTSRGLRRTAVYV